MAACLKSDCSLSKSELLEAIKILTQVLPSFPSLLIGELGDIASTGAGLKEEGIFGKASTMTDQADPWSSALACFRCLSREEVRKLRTLTPRGYSLDIPMKRAYM